MEVCHYNLTKKFNDLSLQLESPIVFLKENQRKPKKSTRQPERISKNADKTH